MWEFIYKNHANDADWFLKACDDSYIIIENLQSFLYYYDPQKMHYFDSYYQRSENSNGGPAYVFSKSTLMNFAKAIEQTDLCPITSQGFASGLANCLKDISVSYGETRDEFGLERFHHFAPQFYQQPDGVTFANWKFSHVKGGNKTGLNCCSNSSIAFGQVTPRKMYTYHYLIYYLEVSPNTGKVELHLQH